MELVEQLTNLRQEFSEKRPVKWDNFPDIEMYKDQVLSYMERQFLGTGDLQLTPAMVNNYVKSGVLPRTTGKKYSKEHLAYLTAICILKQVLILNDADTLIKEKLKSTDIESFYNNSCKLLDASLTNVAELISSQATKEDLSSIVLEMAISSYAQKIACQKLIELMRNNAEAEEKSAEKKSAETKSSEKKSEKKKVNK